MATERASNTILKKIVNIFAAIIVVLLQLFVYYIAFFAFSKEPLVLVIVGILGLISVIYLYNTNNNSSYKLSWTIFILLVPFSGTICYLLFANGQTLPKKRHKKMQKYSEKYYIENNVLASIKDLDLVGYKHA